MGNFLPKLNTHNSNKNNDKHIPLNWDKTLDKLTPKVSKKDLIGIISNLFDPETGSYTFMIQQICNNSCPKHTSNIISIELINDVTNCKRNLELDTKFLKFENGEYRIKTLQEILKKETYIYDFIDWTKLQIDELINTSTYYVTREQVFVIGCPDSTDVDVLIILDNEDIFQDYKNGKIKINFDCIPTLLNDLDYFEDNNREVDINIATTKQSIINGKLSTVLKETIKGKANMTNNIAFNTIHYHRQINRILPIDSFVDLNLSEMIRGLQKFMADNLKKIKPYISTELFNQLHHDKKHNYNEFGMIVLNIIFDTDSIILNSLCKDFMKSLIMKISQIIIYHIDESQCYSKSELAKVLSLKVKQNRSLEDNILYFLFRGKKGQLMSKKVFGELIQYLSQILTLNDINWTLLPFKMPPTNQISDIIRDITNLIMISEDSYRNGSDDLNRLLSTRGINENTGILHLFQKKSDVLDSIPSNFNDLKIALSEFVLEELIICSPEWQKAMELYKTGISTNKVSSTSVSTNEYYRSIHHLLRGMVFESCMNTPFNVNCIVLKAIEQISSIKITFVKQLDFAMILDINKITGFVPDQILLTIDNKGNRTIYIIEIKSITYDFNPKTKNTQRSISIATRQLIKGISILKGLLMSSSIESVNVRGFVAIGNNVNVHCHLI